MNCEICHGIINNKRCGCDYLDELERDYRLGLLDDIYSDDYDERQNQFWDLLERLREEQRYNDREHY